MEKVDNVFNGVNGHEDSSNVDDSLNEEKEQLNDNDKECDGGDDNQNGEKPKLYVKVPQPKRLKNYQNGAEYYDILHSADNASKTLTCSDNVCLSSIMSLPVRGKQPRTRDEVFTEAQDFLKQFYASMGRENSIAHVTRLEDVKKELDLTETYVLKTNELVFGAKLAWRNAARCIGRIQWKKLQIFDCRQVTTAGQMFESLCTHIKYGTNKGNIRSAITIFPPRTDDKHDYRIWNPQLISYAGYREPDGTFIGDPARVDFTDVCIKLGWKPRRTAWDILPLVLSAGGKDPEYFELPPEIIMEVHFAHPNFKWFEELGLRWYALPAVSNMRFDCGGLEFTGTAFNGWYMSTEIACRNLCDTFRYNIIEKVAQKMGLDTSSVSTLWKDRALVEVNVAVLHSYHRDNVSIVDHHSASEQFMKHLENENKSRTGCPADWIWIVPPMSGSLTEVFHQEMALYHIRPSYEYQDPAWKTHQWSKSKDKKPINKKYHFKQIARAVRFISKLFGSALSKRVKATILFATETGKSEQYAKELGHIFSHAFNAQVQCMSEYDFFSIEHETLLLLVASTFGNGEPPGNGQAFIDHLFKMYCKENDDNDRKTCHSAGNPTPKLFMRSNSVASVSKDAKWNPSRVNSFKSKNLAKTPNTLSCSSVQHIGPLSNVCFAVFGLGSSAYPKFCNFGYNLDNLFGELGGERIVEITTGDEMLGQDQKFTKWARTTFQVACETFCLEDNDMFKEADNVLENTHLTEADVRFGKPSGELMPLKSALESAYRKNLFACKVKENEILGESNADRNTIFVGMETQETINYEPGDHVGILACNRKEIVDKILQRIKDVDDFDKPVKLLVLEKHLTPTGETKSWKAHEKLPPVSVRQLFTRFLDITSPPSVGLLKYLATTCTEGKEKKALMDLASDSDKYDDWRAYNYPHLAEVLEEFSSARPQASLLAAVLPPLLPRFYSISSSPIAHPGELHITVAVVVYKTQHGVGPVHYGVCSNYLKQLNVDDEVLVYIRRAPNFHLPSNESIPLILIGPGTGIAPYRAFWSHRHHQMKNKMLNKKPGCMWLNFGCKNKFLDLYKKEKENMLKEGVLTKCSLALSREPGVPKTYVQHLLEKDGAEVTKILLEQGGHLYVCGDCKMAEEIFKKVEDIIKSHSGKTSEEASEFMANFLNEERYHEDIFGITLRTTEVRHASREFARKTRLESTRSEP